MTRYDGPLDRTPLSGLLAGRLLTLYRLARDKYTNLSGIGSALYPGRWNGAGVEAVYTSMEIGATVLERLVHTPKNQIPSNLALMTLELGGEWISLDDATIRSKHSDQLILVYPTAREAQHAFNQADFGSASTPSILAVALPSVIAPVWNLVLYPKATSFFDLVSLKKVERLVLDERLFPDDAEMEALDARYFDASR